MLSTIEASEIVGIDPSQIRRLARSGVLSGVRVGRAWIFEVESLDAIKNPSKFGRPRKKTKQKNPQKH
jgi:excisionase family DNA binding protein